MCDLITTLLQDEAYQWWVSVTGTAPSERVTWEFFLDEFKKHYVGRIYLSNMRREFHNLKQRQMSVTEYQREFTRFSKYAPEILVSEEKSVVGLKMALMTIFEPMSQHFSMRISPKL